MTITPPDTPDWDPLLQPDLMLAEVFLGTSATTTLVSAPGAGKTLALQIAYFALQCVSGSAPAVATISFAKATVNIPVNAYSGVNAGTNQMVDLRGVRIDVGSNVTATTNSATFGADFLLLYQVVPS